MIQAFFRWINVLLILFTLLTYLAPLIDPEYIWGFSFFGLTYPFLLLLHVLFILGWALAKKFYFFMSVACLLIGWNYFQAFVGFGGGSPLTPEIHIGTYNLFNLRGLPRIEGAQRGKEDEALIQLIRQQELDILCTQETSARTSRKLAEKFDFPNTHVHEKRSTAIFSKHPILKKGTILFEHSLNSAVWADIQIKGQTLRVYSVHLQSNRISDDASKLAESGSLQERETWVGIRGILAKYKRAAVVRAAQAKEVAAHVAQSPHPVVVCGDFNDTPLSYSYRQLVQSRMLQDAFCEAGTGLGTTYNGLIPALRIDYALVDPRFSVVDHQIIRKNFSDHFPVFCRLAWN
jgi:endonuclease/exonuclease/phosphatase family metal-dependent hydrolase